MTSDPQDSAEHVFDPGADRAGYVRTMFGEISGRYDLMNRVMTIGQDLRWRRRAAHAVVRAGDTLLAQAGGGIGSKPMIAGIRVQISIGARTDGGGIRHQRESGLGETAKTAEIHWRLQGRVRRWGPVRKQHRAFLGSIQAADPAIARLRMGGP